MKAGQFTGSKEKSFELPDNGRSPDLGLDVSVLNSSPRRDGEEVDDEDERIGGRL
jgi:hypothetical protein